MATEGSSKNIAGSDSTEGSYISRRRRRDTLRRPVPAVVKRHSTLFEPSPTVFSVVRQLSKPNMIDPFTRWVAVPNPHADDVIAALKHRGLDVDLQLGGAA